MAKRMKARYDGECSRCTAKILQGEEILWDGRARHARCPEPAPTREPSDPPKAAHSAKCTPQLLDGDVMEIQNLFFLAKKRLEYPKVRLQTSTGRDILVSIAGERSRHAGQVMISDDLPWGEPGRAYYGRIDNRGNWYGEDIPEDVDTVIKALAANPAQTAAEYGRLTGNCCFCHRKLSDERSTAMGYGRICADHYHLPWG